MMTDDVLSLADKLEITEIRLGNNLYSMNRRAVKCENCKDVYFFNSAEGLRCIAWLHEGHILTPEVR